MPAHPDHHPQARRWFAAATGAVLALSVALAPAASAGPASTGGSAGANHAVASRAPLPDVEGEFVGRVNSLRASRGLSQLSVDGQLLGVARRWTERMVQAGQISHNPNLAAEVSGNWTKLGENVGVGPTVDDLMRAFVNSPAHNRNLVDPEWTHIAVGVTRAADGQLYTTHNFMTVPTGATPPPAPPPPPPPTPTPTTRAPARPSGSTPTTPSPATPDPAPTSTTAPPATPDAAPHPSSERVAAVLDPLRSLERG